MTAEVDGGRPAGAADLAALEATLARLARRAQRPHLVLGVVLLPLALVGLVFFAFAGWIELQRRRLVESLRADPRRARTFLLQTRQVGPLGITAVTTAFAVIGFDAPNGRRATLHLQGKPADLGELLRLLQRVAPALSVEDPQNVRVHVV